MHPHRRPLLHLAFPRLIWWTLLALVVSLVGTGHARTVGMLGGELPLWQQSWCSAAGNHAPATPDEAPTQALAHPCVVCAVQGSGLLPVPRLAEVVDRLATVHRTWVHTPAHHLVTSSSCRAQQARAPPTAA